MHRQFAGNSGKHLQPEVYSAGLVVGTVVIVVLLVGVYGQTGNDVRCDRSRPLYVCSCSSVQLSSLVSFPGCFALLKLQQTQSLAVMQTGDICLREYQYQND